MARFDVQDVITQNTCDVIPKRKRKTKRRERKERKSVIYVHGADELRNNKQ